MAWEDWQDMAAFGTGVGIWMALDKIFDDDDPHKFEWERRLDKAIERGEKIGGERFKAKTPLLTKQPEKMESKPMQLDPLAPGSVEAQKYIDPLRNLDTSNLDKTGPSIIRLDGSREVAPPAEPARTKTKVRGKGERLKTVKPELADKELVKGVAKPADEDPLAYGSSLAAEHRIKSAETAQEPKKPKVLRLQPDQDRPKKDDTKELLLRSPDQPVKFEEKDALFRQPDQPIEFDSFLEQIPSNKELVSVQSDTLEKISEGLIPEDIGKKEKIKFKKDLEGLNSLIDLSADDGKKESLQQKIPSDSVSLNRILEKTEKQIGDIRPPSGQVIVSIDSLKSESIEEKPVDIFEEVGPELPIEDPADINLFDEKTDEKSGWGGVRSSRKQAWIEIDPNINRAIIYNKDGKIIKKVPVGTGDVTGTRYTQKYWSPTGNFKVKNEMAYLSPEGERQGVYGPFFMGINAPKKPGGGFGLHGPWMEGAIDPSGEGFINKGYVSHGCLRFLIEDMKLISKHLDIGSDVEILSYREDLQEPHQRWPPLAEEKQSVKEKDLIVKSE